MTKILRLLLTGFAAVCAVSTTLAVVHARQRAVPKSSGGPGPIAKAGSGAPVSVVPAPKKGGSVLLANAAQSSWPVSVYSALNLTEGQQALYNDMALAVSGYTTVPQDRLNYYSAVNSPPNYVINGWGGIITNVAAQDGGTYLVTVAVFPYLSTAALGASTMVGSDYSEQYSVDESENVTYAGFLDPQGLAGSMPVLSN
jgi:hypothetical protein